MTACLGIDIGGTSIKAARVLADGTLDGPLRTVPIQGDPLAALVQAARQASDGEEVLAAGIGTPGYLDSVRSTVVFAVNLGWRDFALADWAQANLGLPVVVEGDAAAAALGEACVGSGRPFDDVLMVTLGTGIGMGHVVNGQIRSGAHGLAGDAGHVAMPGVESDCPCGRQGCWELVASAGALDRAARAAGYPDAASALADTSSRTVADTWADSVASGLVMLAAVVDPGVIVVGGAVSASAGGFIPRVRERLAGTAPQVALLPAALGGSAGAVGAGLLGWRALTSHSGQTR